MYVHIVLSRFAPARPDRRLLAPLQVYFRVSPTTQIKPFNPNDKSRKPGFLDDDPEFTVCHVEPNHKLILNKYCWLRPQMVLHTRDFQAQTDLLTEADFEASLDVLRQLGGRYMVVFNGGPKAGSSVAHKHLQVFLRPEWATIADEIVAGKSKGASPLTETQCTNQNSFPTLSKPINRAPIPDASTRALQRLPDHVQRSPLIYRRCPQPAPRKRMDDGHPPFDRDH